MWYDMTKLGFRNKHHKDKCYNDIRLCAQNIDTIQSLVVNTIEMNINEIES